MEQARLAYHLFSGVFAGILDVRRIRGELIVSDRGVRSLALLRVCWVIHLWVCLPSLDEVHLASFAIIVRYRRSLSTLVDSSLGALDAASRLNWWMNLTMLCSCTLGMVIVCGIGCDSSTVIPLLKMIAPLKTNLILLGLAQYRLIVVVE